MSDTAVIKRVSASKYWDKHEQLCEQKRSFDCLCEQTKDYLHIIRICLGCYV